MLALLLIQTCYSQSTNRRGGQYELLSEPADSVLVETRLRGFSGQRDLPAGELLVRIGQSFTGTPYVAHTLETGTDEALVVNLREFDCTTFDETCLALALTVKAGKTDFGSYKQQLEKVRYRHGVRDGYLSRLHYFSDWLYSNTLQGLLSPLDSSFQRPFRKPVNFMSTHPGSYWMLKSNPGLVALIAGQEKTISSRNMYFLPKEKLQANEQQLHNGDIVGLTSGIPGLDIAHVGLVIRMNGRVHLLHASSTLKKVVVSDEPLADYLAGKKSFTGIMIARPQ